MSGTLSFTGFLSVGDGGLAESTGLVECDCGILGGGSGRNSFSGGGGRD